MSFCRYIPQKELELVFAVASVLLLIMLLDYALSTDALFLIFFLYVDDSSCFLINWQVSVLLSTTTWSVSGRDFLVFAQMTICS